MKTKITYLLSLISFLTTINLRSQECGTPSTGINQEFSSPLNRSTSDESLCLNVYFHIVRQTNGSGGFNINNIDVIVENLNEYYNPFGIYINKQGVDFIDNSNYYELTDNEFNSLIGINNVSNSINFYLVNSYDYAGRAETILSKNLVVQNTYALFPTSAHELGHCLNLWHTHHGLGCDDTNGCAEAINGTNCSSCGDFVCDTAADPCVLGKLNSNCQYTGGDGYNPDPTNIMSYGGLCRTHFTAGQAQKMRSSILGSSILQQVLSNLCLAPYIDGLNTICNNAEITYTIFNGGNSVVWNISPNLTIISQNQNSITVKPITISTNGEAFIEAVTSSQIIKKTIWIGIPQGVISRTTEYCEGKFHYITFEVSPLIQNINYEWSYFNYPGSWYTEAGNKLYVKLPSTFSANPFQLSVTMTNECGTGFNYYEEIVKKCGTFINQQKIDPINVYPNPANDKLNVEINIENNENYLLQVYDIQANMVFEKKYTSEKIIEIDVTKFKDGNYILILSNGVEKFSKQFIVKP